MLACGNHCDKLFCNSDQLRKHKNSVQKPKEGKVNFKLPSICKTGYEDEPDFHKLVEDKKSEIQDDIRSYSDYTVIN